MNLQITMLNKTEVQFSEIHISKNLYKRFTSLCNLLGLPAIFGHSNRCKFVRSCLYYKKSVRSGSLKENLIINTKNKIDNIEAQIEATKKNEGDDICFSIGRHVFGQHQLI